MGGVINGAKKTVATVTDSGKRIFTGKANAGDVWNVVGSDLIPQAYNTLNHKDDAPPAPSDPFTFDPQQASADQQGIMALGNQQYDDTLAAIDKNSAAQQDYAGQTVNKMLPGIEENLNSQHLLNSSALPQEIARQATYYGQDLASQRASAIQNALVGKQGFQTGAVQRGLSLEDFANQAKVAKAIGATVAPQVGNGKGTAVAGLGAGASAGTAVMPGWGTAIGALGGYLAGGGGGSTLSSTGKGK